MTSETRVNGIRLLGNIATFRAGPEWRKGDRVYSASDLTASQAEVARLRGALESARSYGAESWATWLISEVDDALDSALATKDSK